MRSAMALESRRAQASASLIMTSATVSMPMDLHSAIEVAQHHVSSLQGDLGEMGLDGLWKRGRHGLYGPKPPLSHPLQFPFFHSIREEWLLASHLHPCGLGACLCRSPGGVLKFGVIHFTLIMELMPNLVASETSTCK